MNRAINRAFTLIELLTVIAIIAVLVAILFPVFSRVREQARQTTCLSNMHEIYVKVSLYAQDYDAYPPLLLGLPENPDGSRWQPGGASPVRATDLKHGFLYPAYVRDIAIFHCPNSGITDQSVIVNASFPTGAGFTGNATYASHGIQAANPDEPIPYYAFDTYDVTAALGQMGTYQVVYSRDWTNAEGRGIDPRTDNPNQLKYPNPPADKTIITWCNLHVLSGGDKCPMLLANGTARPVFSRDLQSRSWNYAGN
jgi:prepilin-type N-terminal cleavage/methylation domain-containing protein